MLLPAHAVSFGDFATSAFCMGAKLSTGAAEGRVALITGGASGIGLAAVQRCLSLGMRVAVVDVSEDALQKAEAELGAGDAIRTFACDVSSPESVKELGASVTSAFGPDLAFLFNNAGIVERSDASSALTSSMKASVLRFMHFLAHMTRC